MTSKNTETRGAQLLETLRDEDARLIVVRDGCILYRSDQRGISPLLDALGSLPADVLSGASYADRIIGKAAALLLAHAGAGFVATVVMSEAALGLLRQRGTPTYQEQIAPHIAGRTPGQACPFETSVSDTDDPALAHRKLRQLAGEMGLPT